MLSKEEGIKNMIQNYQSHKRLFSTECEVIENSFEK